MKMGLMKGAPLNLMIRLLMMAKTQKMLVVRMAAKMVVMTVKVMIDELD
jgi:hypothetical protein